jgi:hypothetical protein
VKSNEVATLLAVARRSINGAPKVNTARERSSATMTPESDDELKLLKELDSRM